MQQLPSNFLDWHKKFATEKACIRELERHRWPNGFICPNCGHDQAYRLKHRHLHECKACSRQTSVTAGTVFEHTKLPLTKWFRCNLPDERRQGRHFGDATVETARCVVADRPCDAGASCARRWATATGPTGWMASWKSMTPTSADTAPASEGEVPKVRRRCCLRSKSVAKALAICPPRRSISSIKTGCDSSLNGSCPRPRFAATPSRLSRHWPNATTMRRGSRRLRKSTNGCRPCISSSPI